MQFLLFHTLSQMRAYTQIGTSFLYHPCFTNSSIYSYLCMTKLKLLQLGWEVWVVFLNPEGKCELTYAWGLGESTNNQAEALALYQGLNILTSKEIRSLIVISDSLVIIRQM
jgi:hypothetical protein